MKHQHRIKFEDKTNKCTVYDSDFLNELISWKAPNMMGI